LFDEKKRCISGFIDFGSMRLGDVLDEYTQLYRCFGSEFTREVLTRERPYAGDVNRDMEVIKFFCLAEQIRVLAGWLREGKVVSDVSSRVARIKKELTRPFSF
jgi:hypothetical protein